MHSTGFGYLYGLLNEVLQNRTSKAARDNRLTYLLKWFPGFAVLMVQINWFLASWLFFFNGVKEQARELFAADASAAVDVDYLAFRSGMLAFGIIGTFVSPALLVYTGWLYMGSDDFNSIADMEQEVSEYEQKFDVRQSAHWSTNWLFFFWCGRVHCWEDAPPLGVPLRGSKLQRFLSVLMRARNNMLMMSSDLERKTLGKEQRRTGSRRG